jgi:hypothetical protein
VAGERSRDATDDGHRFGYRDAVARLPSQRSSRSCR